MTAKAWLERLRDATVAPPSTDVVSELLAAWAPIAAARKAIFDEPARPTTLAAELAPLVAELAERERIWHDALAAARDRVVSSRLAVGKARRYQQVTGSADLYRR
ncbi:MAG TPA: hypothetical protein VGL61_09255 [Kofleriaceae bacterium]|jgi:hypothetical protein